MAILAQDVQSVANTNQILYSTPSLSEVYCSIEVCNRSSSDVKIKIGYLQSGSSVAENKSWVDFNVNIKANDSFERTGILLEQDEKIVVCADSTSVSYSLVGKKGNM